MIPTLLTLTGVLLVLVFVLAPLFRPQPVSAPAQSLETSARRLVDLLDQRDVALAGLAELDFDRTLGNLSEADYENLRAQYRAQAVGVLSALDAETTGKRSVPPVSASASVEEGFMSTHDVPLPRTRDSGEGIPGRRALAVFVGLLGASLLAAGFAGLLLRNGPASPGQDAPTLNILHTHAVLLVPGTRVAMVGHHGGLLRSPDEGGSWAPVKGVTGDVLALTGTPVSGTLLYLATAEQIMLSRDVGLTWQPVPLPRPGAQVQSLAAGEGDPTSLYASVIGQGMFRTTNARDWKLVGGELPQGAASLLALRPGQTKVLYVASPGDGVLASADDGKTWGSANGVLNGSLPTAAVRALASDLSSGDQFIGSDGTVMNGAVYAGTDRGLFKSIDEGSSWTAMLLQAPLSAVAARSIPDLLMLAVDSEGRVWRSRDHGVTWSAKP